MPDLTFLHLLRRKRLFLAFIFAINSYIRREGGEIWLITPVPRAAAQEPIQMNKYNGGRNAAV